MIKDSEVAIRTTVDFLSQHKGDLKVYFVLFSDRDLEIYRLCLSSIQNI